MNLSPKALVAEAVRLRRLAAIRKDPVPFAEHAIRSERSVNGARPRIVVADFQRRWYRALADPRVTRLLMMAPPGHGKSATLVAFVTWLLGHRPDSKVLYVGPSEQRAGRFVQNVRSLLEDDAVREVFPDLARGATWTTTGFSLDGQAGRFEALRAVGPGTRILSTRATHILCDDLVNHENADSREQRDRLWDWFQTELLTRAESAETKVVVSNVPVNPFDLPSTLAKQPGWAVLRDPAFREDGAALWPEQWPAEALEAKRLEMGTPKFDQVYMLNTATDARHFRPSDIAAALAVGRGRTSGSRWVGPGRTYMGIDPAFSEDGDRSAIVVVEVLEHEGRRMRRLADAQAGHWSDRELAQRVVAAWYRYRPKGAWLETNGAQRTLLTIIRGMDDSVRLGSHHTTKATKWDERGGVAAISAALERREWMLPSDVDTGAPTPESKLLVDGMLDWTPSGHVDDVLMAAHIAAYGIAKSEGTGWIDVSAALRR